MRNLPSGSVTVDGWIKGTFFLNNIATPLALALKLAWYIWSIQLTFNLFLNLCLTFLNK